VAGKNVRRYLKVICTLQNICLRVVGKYQYNFGIGMALKNAPLFFERLTPTPRQKWLFSFSKWWADFAMQNINFYPIIW
jgi:hypothetical protein